jgi:hypothetical protein
VNAAEVKRKQAARLNAAGHSMTWRKTGATTHLGTCQRCGNWLNAPGWEGSCTRCGDTIRVAWLSDRVAYRAITDASGMPRSFRQCRVRRPR